MALRENLPVIIAATLILAVIIVSSQTEVVKNHFSPTSEAILPFNSKVVQPLTLYFVASQYGLRDDPITNKIDFHTGIDLVSLWGVKVRAVKDGTIVKMEYLAGDYGNYVEMQHLDGTYTLYAHLSAIGNITLNESVGAGSVIGIAGSTGRSTGTHLHFELRNNNSVPIDPNDLLGTKYKILN